MLRTAWTSTVNCSCDHTCCILHLADNNDLADKNDLSISSDLSDLLDMNTI